MIAHNQKEILSFLKNCHEQFLFMADVIQTMNPTNQNMIINLKSQQLYINKKFKELLEDDNNPKR